jgi:hypothetical protein
MATNIKGRIIIGSALFVVVGVTRYILFSGLRKRRILKDIYESIRDTQSSEGQMALFSEEEQIKGTNAFNPNFWEGKGKQKPNAKLLSEITPKDARDIATKINSYMGFTDDEGKIISQIKRLKSQGQISLVASVYSKSPLSYGNLSDDVIDALTGVTDSDSYIKELNNYVNSLPL